MSFFIGREEELKRLRTLLEKPLASFIVLTGRRRIGKSRLLEEFSQDFTSSYFFTGLAPERGIRPQDQKDEFARSLSEYFDLPRFQLDDWGQLFSVLSKKVQSGSTLVVLDEVSWMAHKDPLFLPKLKNAWDRELKRNERLVLALCGSVSSWIEENILSSTGFVGRISETVHLSEIPLKSCSEFWRQAKDRVTPQEKLQFLCIAGGIPRYLEELVPSESVHKNVLRTCFRKEGFFFNEFNRLFSDLFSKQGAVFNDILRLCALGNLEGKKIADGLGLSQGGSLSSHLESLVKNGFLARDFTYEIESNKSSSLSRYRLADNYSRFYLKFIEPFRERIENKTFPDRGLEALPHWSTIMGLSFENLILNNRRLIFDCLQITPTDVLWSGPYFQTKTKLRAGCQVDLLIACRFNTVYICEIKMSRDPIGSEVIRAVELKLKALSASKFSLRPVLISSGAVSERVREQRFFDKIITGDNLLE